MFIKECKEQNKPIVYDLDDDVWNIIDENPAICAKKTMEECGEVLLEIADVVTTTTEELATILRKKNKNVVVVPNAIDTEFFKSLEKTKENLPIVVYSGSASHWNDMLTILPTLEEIKKKQPFVFVLLGFTSGPIESSMYEYKKLQKWNVKEAISKYQDEALKCWEYLKRMRIVHFPFYTPELYPDALSRMINPDIGLCPLEKNVFNEAKSCLKFYEYGASGIATLAPRVLPYSKEVDYTYDGLNDFEAKFIKLLKNAEFRKEVADGQQKWVLENRDINKIVDEWIKVYENPRDKNS
jgi:glycosyltransferase involved in cell wall biosynthesis